MGAELGGKGAATGAGAGGGKGAPGLSSFLFPQAARLRTRPKVKVFSKLFFIISSPFVLLNNPIPTDVKSQNRYKWVVAAGVPSIRS
jgi:hypothetical protein